ncbi:aldo/keto reductase [Coriobacterium glomerans PW2]|uniref:Aldo/keto reductase n=1 Tax=Coriobacterium glomerans (strain ATCC 49209 / DSM 20642 / JCM 10262 / PW2) TaxID=700015 RepID=F2N8Z0_CORGP|nr:aldo/keto reductase [Coriobacterium glomerans]AEB07590.1 aldo/keto reductase [Coriobacterium glomerans PW2]
MNNIKLGDTGSRISQIGLGTWAIGGGPAWDQDLETKTCVDTIVTAVGCGVNLIDTAPGYNFGNSEIMVGRALEHLKREDVILETKFGIVWDRKGALFNKVGDRQLYKNLSAESILKEIDQSLERLGTDYIDIYMSHWQAVEPYFTPIAETMELLTELKRQGKIRAIGAANVTAADVRQYLEAGELDIVQGKYSIVDRGVEDELCDICRQNGIVLQAYSPLEQGLLSGTIERGYHAVGARANKRWFQPGNLERVLDMLDAWKPLCEKYDCSVPTLALAWVLAQGDFISILSGSTSPDQVRENVLAADIMLEPSDVAWMRERAEALG